MSNYTLHYFNARGRAELSRLIFTAAGVNFNDHRIADWPATKGDAPLGQLPYLEFNGTKIPQSISIARYLAREFNLAGKNNLNQAQADAIVDTINDGQNAYLGKVFSVQDPKAKEEVSKKFNAEELPKHLGNLEKLISLYGKNGFSAGDSLTWADLAVFNYTSTLYQQDASLAGKYPHIEKVKNAIESHPKISSYLKTRPVTQF